MSYLDNDTTLNGTIPITKQSGTVVTLGTENKFVDKDIELTLNVQAGSATTPATTITAQPTISVNSSTGLITATNSKTQNVTPTVSAGFVSAGTAGTITVNGSNTSQLTTKSAATYNTSSSDQTISSGRYLTGTQTIKAVTTSNISAANIKSGVTVKVGDANDDDRIAGVAGTFTSSSTVSSGQTAAAAGQILSGYSAWVDGAEVKGNIATKTASNLSASGKTVTVPAGYYATQATKDVATASPSFDGGALTSKGATATFSNATTSASNTSGISIQASGTAGRDAVLYNGAVAGWVSKSDNDPAIAALPSETWSGTTYYLTGVTLAKPSSGTRSFAITVPNGESGTVTFTFTTDSSGNVTIT